MPALDEWLLFSSFNTHIKYNVPKRVQVSAVLYIYAGPLTVANQALSYRSYAHLAQLSEASECLSPSYEKNAHIAEKDTDTHEFVGWQYERVEYCAWNDDWAQHSTTAEQKSVYRHESQKENLHSLYQNWVARLDLTPRTMCLYGIGECACASRIEMLGKRAHISQFSRDIFKRVWIYRVYGKWSEEKAKYYPKH